MEDLTGAINQAGAQMQQMLAAQTAMQEQSLQYSQQSSMEKMKFDFQKASIERMSDLGEAVSRLTERQSQQIAQ